MSIQGLQRAYQYAANDGYIQGYEAYQIERAIFENDNAVDGREKDFIRFNYRPGLADPRANAIFQRLMNWGERSVDEEMDQLRQEKARKRWFNSEYVERAKVLLLQSTDTLERRMAQLRRVKQEASLFTSEYAAIGKEILLSSRDPIDAQLAVLRTFKSEANLWNSEYQQIGKQLIQDSVDVKGTRLQALERFRVDAGLWQSDADAIKQIIDRDFYWDPRGEGLERR